MEQVQSQAKDYGGDNGQDTVHVKYSEWQIEA